MLMTLHTAKGLEFPAVFLIGHGGGVFPHLRALGEPDELEEERRLAYVGITRARERLYLTHAWSRTLWGSTQYNPPSRFLDEIPDELVRDRAGGASGRAAAGRSSRDARSSRRPCAGPRRARPRHRRRALGLLVGEPVVHAKWGEGVVIEVVQGEGRRRPRPRFRVSRRWVRSTWPCRSAPLKRAGRERRPAWPRRPAGCA